MAEYFIRAMHLTPVARFVVPGYGSVSADSSGISRLVRGRCGVPGLSCQTAVAGGVPLPEMSGGGSLGHGAGLVRGHASALASLGRSTVARDQSEKRDQRPGPAVGVGTGELSHGVEFAAQAASGNGSSRT